MGRNKARASLGLSDLPWQGNVGVTALIPIRPRLLGDEVLLLKGGHTGKGHTSWLPSDGWFPGSASEELLWDSLLPIL